MSKDFYKEWVDRDTTYTNTDIRIDPMDYTIITCREKLIAYFKNLLPPSKRSNKISSKDCSDILNKHYEDKIISEHNKG